jgi:MoxR-like ATPase
LFYIYDAVGRFHAAQTRQGSQRSVDYIEYNALGKAILFTLAPAAVAPLVPPGFPHPGRRRSVVLVDEVDKAPRDFPNDILNELEGLYFRVPELGNAEILADRDSPPIVIVTSNSEKHLPEPFLRRCIFYHISFPDERRMREIALAHLADVLQDRTEFLAAALSLFYELRKPGSGLRKKPATAEFLNWIYALHKIAPQDASPLAGSPDRVLQTLGSLAKTPADQETAQRTIVQWMATRNP